DPQGGARTCHGVKKTAAAGAVAAEGQFPMTTVAEVIGVSRSNLMERMRERPKKRIGRRPLPDGKLVAEIKAGIAELPTYGYRRVHAILKRQALAAGLKPSNHKRVYRVMKVQYVHSDCFCRLHSPRRNHRSSIERKATRSALQKMNWTRVVASGIIERIGFFYAVNPDCSASGDINIRITKQPEHGTAETAAATSFPNFERENIRYRCNQHE